PTAPTCTYTLSLHDALPILSVLTRNSINLVMHKDVARTKGITDKSPLADKLRALKGLKLAGSTPGGFSHQMLVYYAIKGGLEPQDRKSTRLNSSHVSISYAV